MKSVKDSSVAPRWRGGVVQSPSSSSDMLSFVLCLGLNIIPMLGLPILFFGSWKHSDYTVIILTLIIQLVAGCLLIKMISRSGVSFGALVAFFWMLFFGVSPLLSYLTGFWLFGDISSQDGGVISFALVICVMGGAMLIVSWRAGRAAFFNSIGIMRWLDVRVAPRSPAVAISIAWLAAAAAFYVFGPQQLFFRGGGGGAAPLLVGGKIVPLVFGLVVRPFALFVFAYMLLRSLATGRGWWGVFWSIIPCIILNFPTAVPRYYLFSCMLVGFFCIGLNFRARQRWSPIFLAVAFLGGIVANQFRFLARESDTRRIWDVDTNYLFAGHFDAFEVFTYGIGYVDDFGLTWGQQLMGAFLFWVPRGLWPGKPIGTGELLGGSYINLTQSTVNTNLSSPLLLEGYINFGIVGVFLFCFVFGFACGGLDGWLRRFVGQAEIAALVRGNVVGKVLLPFWMGLFFFTLRGDLVNAFAAIVGVTVAGILAYASLWRSCVGSVAHGSFSPVVVSKRMHAQRSRS